MWNTWLGTQKGQRCCKEVMANEPLGNNGVQLKAMKRPWHTKYAHSTLVWGNSLGIFHDDKVLHRPECPEVPPQRLCHTAAHTTSWHAAFPLFCSCVPLARQGCWAQEQADENYVVPCTLTHWDPVCTAPTQPSREYWGAKERETAQQATMENNGRDITFLGLIGGHVQGAFSGFLREATQE